jgi:hypothetical protein
LSQILRRYRRWRVVIRNTVPWSLVARISQNDRMGRVEPQNQRTRYLLFGAFGLLLVLISLGRTGLDCLYTFDGRETVGTILYSGETYGSHQMAHSYVTYEFLLPDGRSFQSSPNGYSRQPAERIRIQYLGDHPSFSRVAGSRAKDQQWLLLGILGLLMMALSTHWLVVNRKRPVLTT